MKIVKNGGNINRGLIVNLYDSFKSFPTSHYIQNINIYFARVFADLHCQGPAYLQIYIKQNILQKYIWNENMTKHIGVT
jgi:hypothetical protein